MDDLFSTTPCPHQEAPFEEAVLELMRCIQTTTCYQDAVTKFLRKFQIYQRR